MEGDNRPQLTSAFTTEEGMLHQASDSIRSSEMKTEVACGLPPNSTLRSRPVSPSDNEAPVCSAGPVFAEHLLCARSSDAEGP